MSKQYQYSGTGDPLVEVELPGDHGTFVLKDDGDNDAYVGWALSDGNGETSSWTSLRREIDDDEQFIDILEAAFGGDTTDDALADGETQTAFNSAPVFKCDDCNRSWPRRQNQTPDQPTDTCPECDTEDS